MPYRVRARQRGQWPGRWRSGHYFSASDWTALTDDQMTPGILADPELIVETVEPDPPANVPSEPEQTETPTNEPQEAA